MACLALRDDNAALHKEEQKAAEMEGAEMQHARLEQTEPTNWR